MTVALQLSTEPAGLPDPTRTILLNDGSPDSKRRDILAYFQKTFLLYESLFDCLANERAWFTKAIPIRHPLIFYFGHTAAFFINKLLAAGLIDRRVDARIESLVAIGVDEMSWDDLNERNYDWPSIEELRSYRAQIYCRVSDFIGQMPVSLPIDWASPAWVILMGIEHERIHLETSSVLIRQLPVDWVRNQPYWPACPLGRRDLETVPLNDLVSVEGREIWLGKRDPTYGWDNEYGRQRVQLESFEASRLLVSNAEFLQFVTDGGYDEPRWWSEEGFAWRTFANAVMPTFWVGSPGDVPGLQIRLMTEQVPMLWDWPVEINALEATAFCRWKAARSGRPVQLPCEAEWCLLRERVAGDQPGWVKAPGNINLEYWASSCPVDYFAQGEFFDIVGNVWQWTSTAVDGYPGFKVHPLYDDFSTPTFDGKHDLIKGGSWISTGNEALSSSRYAFRRHFFQHAGLRYVVSTHREPTVVNRYETDELVTQYIDLHFGPEYFGVRNFPKALAQIAGELRPSGGRALNIGCSVGRASFELGRYFEHVDAVDYTARLIDVALQLASRDCLRYTVPTEGELVEYREVRLSALDLRPEDVARVHFSQGDALNLKPKYDGYDLVLAANLLDRLQDPTAFLDRVRLRMKSGALLLLTCAYTWREEFTRRENWLGGNHENGEALTGYHAIRRILSPFFDEVPPQRDIPLVIRETARKYEHIVAQLTVWRLR